MNAFLGLMHNGKLIDNAETILQDALNNGTAIYIENPDGTRIRLQPGFKLEHWEAVLFAENGEVESINFNKGDI